MAEAGWWLAARAAVVLRGMASRPSEKRRVGASLLAFTMGCHLDTSLLVSSYLASTPGLELLHVGEAALHAIRCDTDPVVCYHGLPL